LIVTRGRTDGDAESPAESRVARERAAAARAFLVQNGVDPARIRTTYQPVGDHTSDNDTPEGRALNRRVEIELYGVVPQVLVADQAMHGSDAEASAQ
jgi:outer membrane protein OmpA-like peptidoglycan-associated protein